MKRRKSAQFIILTHYPSQEHRADTALELKNYIRNNYGGSISDHHIYDTKTKKIVLFRDIK